MGVRVIVLSLAGAATIAIGERGSTWTPPGAPNARCNMSLFAYSRDTAATYIVGRGTNDTVAAGIGSVPVPAFAQPGHISVFGQVIRLDSIGGAAIDIVRNGLAARDSGRVVVVPWGYNPGCATDFWTGSARWVTPDSSGFFVLRLRAESLWVDHRPTFDALLASIYSYADGPYTAGPHTRVRGAANPDSTQPPLTPAELFGLYLALPSTGEVRARDTIAFARFHAWDRANPTARKRYPGTLILAGWR